MNRIKKLLVIIIVLPLLGALGFMLVEHMSVIDAMYMSFITLSTVGYEVVKPLSDRGKLFVIIFIVVSFSLFFYSLSQLGEMIVKGELSNILKGRIMERQIAKFKDHAIICGFGRMGQSIARELHHKGQDFVIIDMAAERVESAIAEGWSAIQGDASSDSVLLQAGILRARCLTTVLAHDPDNLFCVMSASLLNRNLTIIARSATESAIDKLKRAGATRIVSPYSSGAVTISQLMMHPELEDFIEIFTGRHTDIDLSVLNIRMGSSFIGQSIETFLDGLKGALIIGLRSHGKKIELPPPNGYTLNAGDALIAVGKIEALGQLLDRLSKGR